MKREAIKNILDLLGRAMEEMDVYLDADIVTAQQELVELIEEELENTTS